MKESLEGLWENLGYETDKKWYIYTRAIIDIVYSYERR